MLLFFFLSFYLCIFSKVALPVEPVICQCLFRVAFRINILADRTCHTSFDLLLLKWTKNRLQFHGLTWGKLWQTLDDDVENSESKTEKSSAQVFFAQFLFNSTKVDWPSPFLPAIPMPSPTTSPMLNILFLLLLFVFKAFILVIVLGVVFYA